MDSGLKINFLKIKLIEVGVSYTLVTNVVIGCNAAELPFIHLGVPVGQNMTRVFCLDFSF